MRPSRPLLRWAAVVAAVHATLAGPIALAGGIDSPAPDERRGATHTVFVHLDSPEPVDLQRGTGQRYDPFATVCASPCDTLVPGDGIYRISSDSVRSSHDFSFPIDAQREDVRVNPASRGGFTAGILLLSGGVASIAIGGLWLIGQGLGDGAGAQDDGQGARPIFLGLVLGGLAAVVGGTVLAVLNAKTTVSRTETSTPPPVQPMENPARTVLLPTRSGADMDKALPATTAIQVLAIGF